MTSPIERVAELLRQVKLPTKPAQAHNDLLMRIAGVVHEHEKSKSLGYTLQDILSDLSTSLNYSYSILNNELIVKQYDDEDELVAKFAVSISVREL